MTIQMGRVRVGGPCSPAVVEAALRWLAIRKEGGPLRFLRYAIEDPSSESATVLDCLVGPTASMPGGTSEARALGIWGLITDEVGKIGSADESRRRNTLIAAFRLGATPGDHVRWKSTLDDRFGQLRRLTGVFGDPPPSTTTPMHKAWRRAVGDKLAPCLARRLELLEQDGEAWQPYVEIGRAASAEVSNGEQIERRIATPRHRLPSEGAQPVFMELMIVTVLMRQRTVFRRTTERKIIACEDGVDTYVARALNGWTDGLESIPIDAIWGCRVEASPGAHPGDPLIVGLRFPKELKKGDRHYFVSEAYDRNLDEERIWVNVDVDHHGIAPGVLDRDGRPTAGLCIRINFLDCVPEACWWYAEQTDHERKIRPPAGDRRLLEVRDGFVQHTFLEGCHPREEYGVAFRWPQP